MGDHEGWAEPSGLLLSGLLPNEAASVTRALDMERWFKAEERTAELIACIQPNQPSEERRNAVADYVQRLIMKCFSCEVGGSSCLVFTSLCINSIARWKQLFPWLCYVSHILITIIIEYPHISFWAQCGFLSCTKGPKVVHEYFYVFFLVVFTYLGYNWAKLEHSEASFFYQVLRG